MSIPKDFDYAKFGNQLNAGTIASERHRHAHNNAIWHTDSKGLYWCGNWYYRTKEQLLEECESTAADLRKDHADLPQSVAVQALERLAPFINDCMKQIGGLVIQDFGALNEGLILMERAGVNMPKGKK